MSPKSAFTVQKAQEAEPMLGGMSLPITFITELDVAPDWDLHDRDAYLRTFWKRFGNDMLQSVVATGVAKVQTQNWELEGPEKLADMFHHMYRDDADFGRGYDSLISRGVESYYTQDSGWFMERLRSGPKDFDGPMLGISHLDSARMRATGNDEFPWTYQDVHGEYHLMHRAQFIRIVDMPTPRTELYGMQKGFCALSRVLSTAMILTLIVAMKRERLADLPPSALAIFNNINRKQFQQALSLRTMQEDMSGNMVWRQLLPLFGIDPAHPASVQFLSLREVWESYDDRTAYDISAYSYAAGFRFDPREFWPVSQGPLGTGREAELQHQKAKGKSHGLIFTALERSLNADWSQPKELKFKFVLQDIEEEEQRAAIHSVQITNIKSMQEAGAALTTDEVRYLLATQYKVIPRIMASVPEEGEEVDLTHADVFMDDVERQAKEYMYIDFGPPVIVDSLGHKTYLPSGKVRHNLCIPGGNGKDVDAGKTALVAALKGDFVCCPSHAAQMFPDVVDDLARLNYLTSEQVYMANLVDDDMIGGVVRATKQAMLSGDDVLKAASGELSRQLVASTLVLGTKEGQALQTINQKISSLDNTTARVIREDAKRLWVAMSSPRRYAALKDIPDDVWEDAVRADALDDQEKAFKGGSGSGNWGHTGRPGLVGGSGGRGGAVVFRSAAGETSKFSDAKKIEFGDMLDELPRSHSHNLEIVASDAPSVREFEFDGKYLEPWGDVPAQILLRPNAKADTLLHELGHHVTRDLMLPSQMSQGELTIYMREQKVIEQNWWKLGLSEYEASGSEQLPGMYRVYAKVALGDSSLQTATNVLRDIAPATAGVFDELFASVAKEYIIPIEVKGGAGSGNWDHKPERDE